MPPELDELPDEPLIPPEFDELPDEPLMPPELDELPDDALRPEELPPCELLLPCELLRSGEEAELPVEPEELELPPYPPEPLWPLCASRSLRALPSPCDELPRFWPELLDEPLIPPWLPDEPEVFLSAMIMSSKILVDVRRSRARRPPARPFERVG